MSTGLKSKRNARRFMENVEEAIETASQGLALPPSLQRWVNEQSDQTRRQLARHGVVGESVTTVSRWIDDHLTDYIAHLKRKRRNAAYVRSVEHRAGEVFKAMNVTRLGEIRPGPVEHWLAEQIGQGMATSTANRYMIAASGFLRWCVADGRLERNPLDRLHATTVTDAKRRRALTEDELCKLLDTVRVSTKVRRNLSGEERYWLYRLAVETGLRRRELRESRYDMTDCTVTIPAGVSKVKGREEVVPLHPQTVADMRAADFTPPPFVPDATGEILAADLKDAKVETETPDGVVDFHALRHTFCTRIGADPSVSFATAMSLMRHTSPQTTKRYLHHRFTDMVSAIAKLPVHRLADPVADSTGTHP